MWAKTPQGAMLEMLKTIKVELSHVNVTTAMLKETFLFLVIHFVIKDHYVGHVNAFILC